MSGANEQLRELLLRTGWTYDSLARAVNRVAAEHGEALRTNKSSITHWIAGTRPQRRTLAYLAEAVSRRLGRQVRPVEIGFGSSDDTIDALPHDPVDALTRLGRSDVDRRQLLTGTVYSMSALLLPVDYQRELSARADRAANGAIGWAEVDAVVDITAAFNRADERLGGGFGRTAVVEYLTTDVAAYCQARGPQPVRRAMFSAGAQLAYLSGWKAHDIGHEGLAQRYYLHAYQLAVESGDQGQAAYIMRILAHQAYDMGHHAHCVDLASASVRAGRGHVDSHTEALLLLTLAKAYAMRGDRSDVLRTISEAETLMSRARPGDERPAWAGLHGRSPAQFNNHVAKALVELGDFAGAEEHYRRSVRLHLDPVNQPRIYALTMCWLAEAQIRQGHLEQACASWSDAVNRFEGIRSARTQESVRTMKQLLAPYRNRAVPSVDRLLRHA
jgi:hypothetical protein